jgi:2-phosphoglycerate kinase
MTYCGAHDVEVPTLWPADVDHEVDGDAGASDLYMQMLIIEELGRRGMQRLSLTQLRLMLQFAGCKPQLCHAAAVNFFHGLQELMFPEDGSTSPHSGHCSLLAASASQTLHDQWSRRLLRPVQTRLEALEFGRSDASKDWYLVGLVPRVAFTLKMEALLLSELRGNFATPDPLRRLSIVTTVVERHVPLVVFCGGTSGCGKSTLANLLASLLGIRTIVSTDSVRELLRGQCSPEECPELFSSTYEAWRMPDVQRQQLPGTKTPTGAMRSPTASSVFAVQPLPKLSSNASFSEPATPSVVQRIVTAYEKQSHHVLNVLDCMIDIFIRRNESVVIEGVHLLSPYMLRKASDLAYSGIPCVPVLFQIVNEAKHKERFAIRAKSMTMLPRNNKYVEHFTAIRAIQAHLVGLASNTDVLIVNNTNVDKSLSTIHECIIGCLENFSTSTKGTNGTFMPAYVARERPKMKGKELLGELLARREAKRTQERVRSAEARSTPHQRQAEASLVDEKSSPNSAGAGTRELASSALGNRSQSAGLPNRGTHARLSVAAEEDDHGSLIGS